MSVSGCSLRAAALLAFSVATTCAQQSNLSYVALNPCCIAVDAKGNDFIVSSGWPDGSGPFIYLPPPTISVTKIDASGNVVSTFPFQAGAGDLPTAAAVDSLGNLWIVGSTVSTSPGNAPTVGLIAKLDNTGTHLLYTGTFGGLDPGGTTAIDAIAFDPGGNLYLAGSTSQLDFPVTPGAFITQIPTAGPTPSVQSIRGARDTALSQSSSRPVRQSRLIRWPIPHCSAASRWSNHCRVRPVDRATRCFPARPRRCWRWIRTV